MTKYHIKNGRILIKSLKSIVAKCYQEREF